MSIEQRPFGRTGHHSSAVIFGAAALKNVDQAAADRTLDLLLEHGVNHIDTAASYGDAELRIGPWMARHRDQFFLASKTGIRDYQGARTEIHRSLDRLRTDHLDLLQLHALFHPDEWDQAFGTGGALEACLEAKDQGLVRFLGVTGHGWTIAAMHQRSLERFDFDSILLPWSWYCAQQPRYAADFEAVRSICQARNVAIQTIKAIARGPWAAGVPERHNTWYEPLDQPEDIRLAVHWLLAQPGLFLNSVGDLDLLPLVLAAASEPTDAAAAPAPDAMAAMEARTGLASIFGLA